MKQLLPLLSAVAFLGIAALLSPTVSEAQSAGKSAAAADAGSTAKGSFKSTYATPPGGSGGGDMNVRTSSQGTDSKEPAKPENTQPKTSFQDPTVAGADAGKR
jgi:hypothetical protein